MYDEEFIKVLEILRGERVEKAYELFGEHPHFCFGIGSADLKGIFKDRTDLPDSSQILVYWDGNELYESLKSEEKRIPPFSFYDVEPLFSYMRDLPGVPPLFSPEDPYGVIRDAVQLLGEMMELPNIERPIDIRCTLNDLTEQGLDNVYIDYHEFDLGASYAADGGKESKVSFNSYSSTFLKMILCTRQAEAFIQLYTVWRCGDKAVESKEISFIKAFNRAVEEYVEG